MIKRIFLALTVAVAIAGCSSVPLTDVPVEDKSATTTVPGGGQPGGGTQSSVAPVVATWRSTLAMSK